MDPFCAFNTTTPTVLYPANLERFTLRIDHSLDVFLFNLFQSSTDMKCDGVQDINGNFVDICEGGCPEQSAPRVSCLWRCICLCSGWGLSPHAEFASQERRVSLVQDRVGEEASEGSRIQHGEKVNVLKGSVASAVVPRVPAPSCLQPSPPPLGHKHAYTHACSHDSLSPPLRSVQPTHSAIFPVPRSSTQTTPWTSLH